MNYAASNYSRVLIIIQGGQKILPPLTHSTTDKKSFSAKLEILKNRKILAGAPEPRSGEGEARGWALPPSKKFRLRRAEIITISLKNLPSAD